jgi:MFS family permease
LGKLADQKYGEKEILIISLIITLLSTVAIALTASHSFWYWAALLFASRVGIAGVEVMKDTHFYRHISSNDVDVISFFRTSMPVASILVAALATGMLAFLPLVSVFYLTAIVLSLTLFTSFFIVDSK